MWYHKCKKTSYPVPPVDKELKEFLNLSKLPIEIRMIIWELALTEARVVLFRYESRSFRN